MARASAHVFVREGARVLGADVSGREQETAEELGDAFVPFHADVSQEADVEAMFAAAVEAFGRVDAVLERRGHRQRRSVGRRHRRGVRPDHVGQPPRRDARHQARHPHDGADRRRLDRQLVVDRRHERLEDSSGHLLRVQGGRDLVHEAGGDRVRPRGHPRQRDLPRLDRHRALRRPRGDREVPSSRQGRADATRAGEPEEVAELACFLASDRAPFLTGAVIPIDGGLTATTP